MNTTAKAFRSKRRLILITAVAATLTAGLTPVVHAQGPMTMMVPFPPGGSTDIIARIIQPKLAERLGRPLIVENRPGAASQIATQAVGRAAPDGNTVLVSFDTHAINPVAKSKLPYDTFKDFTGVSLLVRFPLVLGAHPSVPGNNLTEFLAAARTGKEAYNYASTGLGSLNHLVAEELKRRASVDLLHVPYNGAGPATQAVISNTSQLTFLSYAALRGQIQGGKVKPLAVTGAERLADLPDVPTVAESGFPGFEAYSWSGIFVPSATPAATVKQLTADFQAVLADPEVREKLTKAGFEVIGSDGPTLDRYARAEHDRWKAFVKSANLKLEE